MDKETRLCPSCHEQMTPHLPWFIHQKRKNLPPQKGGKLSDLALPEMFTSRGESLITHSSLIGWSFSIIHPTTE